MIPPYLPLAAVHAAARLFWRRYVVLAYAAPGQAAGLAAFVVASTILDEVLREVAVERSEDLDAA